MHSPIDDFEFPPGTVIYQQGQSAAYTFTLRTGLVKIVHLSPDGEERILRVLRPGALAGLEALVSGKYGQSAIALSVVRACRIPIEVIQQLDRDSPRMHRRLMEKWGEALQEADSWFAELNVGSAEQRVARLLLKMHDTTTGESVLFRRDDMGAMLGLTLETVSRKISQFRKDGAIAATDDRHAVKVLDRAALLRLAEQA